MSDNFDAQFNQTFSLIKKAWIVMAVLSSIFVVGGFALVAFLVVKYL